MENQKAVDENIMTEQNQPPRNEGIPENQKQQNMSEKKDSFMDKIKKGSRILAEKSTKAKDRMADKIAKNEVNNYTLKEAMAKIEKEIFAGTKILQDLDAKFTGSARKLRDQTARKTAKIIYERWHDDREKEEMKEVIELDYNDV